MEKKRLIRLQVHPYRDSLTGLIRPVSLYLWGITCSCCLRRLLFATQRDDLRYRHVAYPGGYNYSCGSVTAGLYL
jgi:hypothetical protein